MYYQDWEPQPYLPKPAPCFLLPASPFDGISWNPDQDLSPYLQSVLGIHHLLLNRNHPKILPPQPFSPHVLQIRRWLGFCLSPVPHTNHFFLWNLLLLWDSFMPFLPSLLVPSAEYHPPHSLKTAYLKDAFCRSSHILFSNPSSLLVSDPWLTEFWPFFPTLTSPPSDGHLNPCLH